MRQVGQRTDLQAPALVVGEVPVEHVELVKKHPILRVGIPGGGILVGIPADKSLETSNPQGIYCISRLKLQSPRNCIPTEGIPTEEIL